MKHLRLLLLIAVACLIGGCGYQFGRQGTGLRPDIQRVAIPLFQNESYEPQLETVFANALRRQFMLRGRLEVVSTDYADIVFRGAVKSISTETVAHRGTTGDTVETRIGVTVLVQCEDPRSGTVIWRTPPTGLSESSLFLYSSDPILTFDSRRLAIEKIAEEMAMRIYNSFHNSF